MSRVVVDTNVLIVANEQSDQADVACAAKAARFLQEALERDIVVIDTIGMAIDEYRRYCSFAGEPGVGDLFFSEVFRNVANENRVTQIDIGDNCDEVRTKIPDSLVGFDPSDIKWIALYLHGGASAIYNAVDSDYSEWADTFAAEGIEVEELCPHCLRVRPSES
ncbi:hypothetical protein [Mycobacterium colombiense]